MKILIVGASKGLGQSLLRAFSSRGDQVWGVSRTPLAAPSAGGLSYSVCDTTRRQDVEGAFAAMREADFLPDVILFCAGAAFDDVDGGRFDAGRYGENFSLNLFGVMLWIELFLPLFLDRRQGTFAAISSMSVYVENHPHRIGYSASRLALNKSFENLRMEYAGSGVCFSIFTMGRMSENGDRIGVSYEKAARAIMHRLCSGRAGEVCRIPFSQYLLTRIAAAIPSKIFVKYLRK